MANISIPLFDVKIGSFDLPVTLSYHNNGLKTNEIPSWVGLGWDISSFGVINIQTRGNGDFADEGNGMFSTIIPSQQKLQKYLQNQMTDQEKYDYVEGVIRGDYDSEYDLYSYSFLGQSGSFYLDANQNIICVPQSNLKITKEIDGFTIVDERGNKYYFGLAEHTESTPFPENDLYARKSFNGTGSYLLSYITTSDNRTISFGYTQYPFNYHTTSEYAKAYNRPKFKTECPDNSYVSTQTNIYLTNCVSGMNTTNVAG
ncbi:hypothetical protein A4D02_34270 [Niastella koreensis]|nr:hypothetical protein A4D02_34270 [Niastella koreensis]